MASKAAHIAAAEAALAEAEAAQYNKQDFAAIAQAHAAIAAALN